MSSVKKYTIYTKSSKVIGSGDSSITSSFKNGTYIDNVSYGDSGYFCFVGKPHGSDVFLFDFYINGQYQFRAPKRSVLKHYQIPVDEIICAYDFQPMRPTINSFEKKQTEKQFELKEVLIRFLDFGAVIKGKTYLHKLSLANGIIKIYQREPGWFILQNPESYDMLIADDFYFFEDLMSLERLSGNKVDHILINMKKISVGVV
ncbi:MAG: hypothetical protein JXR48_17070 [Candidatus Delongbacteria bacterium]|nr:hypothetical protein [Candidatus Delongbacteria bacterium]MBN2836670.1 hypothetical protein [Candidatus Delongbacteria bacterium]